MKKVLVVIDMQNDFIDGSLGTKEAVSIVPRVKEKLKVALEEGIQVCFTLDTHKENYLNTLEGKNLPVAHCIKGTKGWELSSELVEVMSYNIEENIYTNTKYPLFEKPVFGSLDLANYIVKLYEEDNDLEVELVGLCTDICVVSNAMLLRSFVPELKILVDASCCAGVTPESHRMALETMKMCQVAVSNQG